MRRNASVAGGATLLGAELTLAGRLDARFFALLEAIDQTGSINRAARTAGYSYKGAWLLLESAANLASQPLIETGTGGKGGGGTRLTPAAFMLLDAWRRLQAANRAFLHEQEAWLNQLPAVAGLLRRIAMKTTARNQLAGTIDAVVPGPVTTQVSVTIPGGEQVVATVTTAAAGRLKLEPGKEAILLIKSSAVVLVLDFAGYSLSARNQFSGTISRVERGAVSSLVVLTLPGGTNLTASVTNDAVDALALAVGMPATAVFKAYSVMVAVAG
ncbi:molybdate transport system regulatory protein [Paraburkholderia caballeronis]|uniref:TOBE domain-containing protein n=1 Tax=Paraburkholderia caballeronis TaxID=416943 RepID=UPI0010E42A85|nr:TOBE domain-containing protein [Paraburkholderia caballeronis]TDV26900.1 molybdate transport system regulatory protein [Paraburkholderia caballeronis]